MTSRHILAAFAAVLAVTAACGRTASPRLPSPVGVDRHPRLTTVASCDQLETAIENSVVLAMKSQVEQLRTGWGGVVYATGGPMPAATPSSSPSGPGTFTTTNTQVAGVDEADFVQNDGTRIAALAGGRLHLVSSWPADALAEAASVAIEGWPRELFLTGNQVVVFSSVYVPRTLEGDHPVCAGPLMGAAAMPTGLWCGYAASDVTKITTVDVTALGAPKVTAEIYLPGRYVAARRIDARVRLVLVDDLPFPDGVRLWPDVPAGASDAERNRVFDDLEAQDEALIRARTLDDWLRRGKVVQPGGTTRELDYACGDFALSSAPSRPGILTVATLDLATQALVARTSVLAQAGVVYA